MATRRPKEPEVSTCVWSDDPEKRYRYILRHTWRSPDLPSYVPSKVAVWIGLNPSTAFEGALDPTLRRVRAFSRAMGADTFVMLNLFAYRATRPADMLGAPDPIGPENDRHIMAQAHADNVVAVVAMWGNHGRFKDRDREVMEMLAGKLSALRVNKDGTPAHCLYLPATCRPLPYGYVPPVDLALKSLDTPTQPC